jgi:NAD+ synthase (glutamine-hydrolysing)
MLDNLADPARDLVRVCAATPELRIADTHFNVQATLDALRDAGRSGAQIVLFPELGLTSYTCADLFNSSHLIHSAQLALRQIAVATKDLPACVVGLPVEAAGRLFNCAAFCAGGRVIGIVPKTHLPNGNEFYEKRWFAGAIERSVPQVLIGDEWISFGTDLLFEDESHPGVCIGIEICEDLWAVEPPSGSLALAGAVILLNPSASNELIGKAPYRRDLVRQQSARTLAAYVYASSGPWESSTDLVFSGHTLIAECGRLLAEGDRFSFSTKLTLADIDVAELLHERRASTTFRCDTSARGIAPKPMRHCRFNLSPGPDFRNRETRLLRPLPRHPFVPDADAARSAHCEEIFTLQATALARRLRHTRSRTLVIGISGGLDSTLALLVCLRAVELCGLEPSSILAVTMPGFGTTNRTRNNALALAEHVGATLRTVPIEEAVNQHFRDIGHPPDLHDVTYENSQARERTQVLMDLANQNGGIVIGTGDLSEAALGWCTFNGDHMSMYHVNIGVPKTLVRHLVRWHAANLASEPLTRVLEDILATPITPELLPLKEGELQQETEVTVGPYELHDFFLFHLVRHQATPAKIHWLASRAFEGIHSPADIRKWLQVFLGRFFSQQFKRNPMPEGPKIGSVALSPRGDWRMPGDVSGALWRA